MFKVCITLALIPKDVEETPKKTSDSVVEDILANDISTPTGIRLGRAQFLRPKINIQSLLLVLPSFHWLITASSAVKQMRQALLKGFDLLLYQSR